MITTPTQSETVKSVVFRTHFLHEWYERELWWGSSFSNFRQKEKCIWQLDEVRQLCAQVRIYPLQLGKFRTCVLQNFQHNNASFQICRKVDSVFTVEKYVQAVTLFYFKEVSSKGFFLDFYYYYSRSVLANYIFTRAMNSYLSFILIETEE